MIKDDVVKSIVLLPDKFNATGNNKSANKLLAETGYANMREEIKKQDILFALRENPASLKNWLSWSENKRSEEGWYVTQTTKNIYIVGFFDMVKGHVQVKEYTDVTEACAAFIMNEIERIRQG